MRHNGGENSTNWQKFDESVQIRPIGKNMTNRWKFNQSAKIRPILTRAPSVGFFVLCFSQNCVDSVWPFTIEWKGEEDTWTPIADDS